MSPLFGSNKKEKEEEQEQAVAETEAQSDGVQNLRYGAFFTRNA